MAVIESGKTSIKFIFGQRSIVTGSQWHLDVTINESSIWTVATWPYRPSDEQLSFAKALTLRSMKAYHTATTGTPFHFSKE